MTVTPADGPLGYAPPGFRAAIDLDLSKNEGRAPAWDALAGIAPGADTVRRYPALDELRAAMATTYGVPTDTIVVTAGIDDALLRLCLAQLGENTEAVVASPTFEMIPRYVTLARGTLRAVPWPDGPFPTAAFLAAITPRTKVAFVVSPNNPTGGIATAADLRAVAAALPDGVVALDAAYAEFRDDGLPAVGLELDNVVVLRTLSKAWGLAGLRVGCAIARPELVARLFAAGNPMPVSVASASLATRRLQTGTEDLRDHVAQVATERTALTRSLRELGADVAEPTCANFVLARGLDPAWMTAALAALGIAIRRFPDREELAGAVRIGLPGTTADYARLEHALRTTLAPAALLFDMDGVLAEVSESYRAAIQATAASYGVDLTSAAIAERKAQGNANDDWALTHELVSAAGVTATLADVTARFEERYQELRARESLMVDKPTLLRWRERYRLGVVTGRPRSDAEYFLRQFDLLDVFDAVVCREDAALKPDPAPVRLALERLGVRTAWMLGDTPDDHDAARGAGVLPIAVGPDDPRAAAMLPNTPALEDLLP